VRTFGDFGAVRAKRWHYRAELRRRDQAVIVTFDRDALRVVEPDDCTRLSVTTALPLPELDAALRASGLGRLEGEAALLDAETLRAGARELATEPDWDTRWQAMLDYATGKGWVSENGRDVRAHVETARSAQP
jgi:hypothetical protein